MSWSGVKSSFLYVMLLAMTSCIAPITPVPAAGQEPVAAASTSETPAAQGESSTDGEKAKLVIATGATGGVFLRYGEGLAAILNEKMADTNATTQETAGSVENMKLVNHEDAQIGFSTVDSAYDAVQGAGAYTSTGPISATAIAVLYQSFLHVVVRADSGISTLPDMTGKHISVGASGSSTAIAAGRLLEAAGIDPVSGIEREAMSLADSTAALTDGSIDGFFWIGGLPTDAISGLTNSTEVTVTFLDASEYLPALVAKYGPVYSDDTLPQATYHGLSADVPGIGIGNILFVNSSMSEEMAYQLLTTIFDNLDDVHAILPSAATLSLNGAVEGSSIPFHPGAIQFYKDQGVWQE